MRITTGLLLSSVACVGLGFGALALATPAQAAAERIVLHSQSYANKPGTPIKFDCQASPGLVGKTAQIKQVGGSFQRSVTIKKNGSCDISGTGAKGEHAFVVVVSYVLANGKTKTVTSNSEEVLVGKDN
jgi:hypothetical protein